MKRASTLDLFLPITFLKNAISLVESDPDSSQNWQGQNGTSTCFIVTGAQKNATDSVVYLSISLKNIQFKLKNKTLTCQITDTEKTTISDSEKPSDKENVNHDTLVSVNHDTSVCNPDNDKDKRKEIQKRGRKRKSETVQQESENNVPEYEPTEGVRGRYRLRGVKLSESIMKAVKGEYNVCDVTTVKEEHLETNEEKIDDHISLYKIKPIDKDDNIECEDDDTFVVKSEDDEDFSIAEEMGSDKRMKRKKLLKTDSTKNIRTRKNRKIDLGDIPKFERRKRHFERTASCKYCGKCFLDYTGVDLHVRKYHTKEDDFELYISDLIPLKIMTCDTCGMKFNDRFQLQDHENRNHLKTTKAKCFRCNKIYKNVNSLRNHVRSVHLVKGQPNLCHLCPAKFKWRVTLRQHIEEIHDGRMNSVCGFCGKKFARDSLLRRHQRIHGVDPSKRLVCNKCGKGFWYECNLQRHMQCVHSDQQEMFHCSYCGKGFNNKYGMVTHVQQVHFNLYAFKCQQCNSGFASQKLLKEHLAKIHNLDNVSIDVQPNNRFKYGRKSEDLFFCSYCSKSFCYKAKLVEHMHTVHAEAFPYKCTHCNQGFLEKSFLLHHLEKAHGEEKNYSEAINDINNDLTRDTTNIAKLVTLNIGPGNKSVYTIQNTKPKEQEVQPQDLKGEISATENEEISSSVLFEVSTGSGTIQYVIQQPEDGGPAVLPQELADLLLAAESVENFESQSSTGSNSAETVTFLSSSADEHVEIVSCSDLVDVEQTHGQVEFNSGSVEGEKDISNENLNIAPSGGESHVIHSNECDN